MGYVCDLFLLTEKINLHLIIIADKKQEGVINRGNKKEREATQIRKQKSRDRAKRKKTSGQPIKEKGMEREATRIRVQKSRDRAKMKNTSGQPIEETEKEREATHIRKQKSRDQAEQLRIEETRKKGSHENAEAKVKGPG